MLTELAAGVGDGVAEGVGVGDGGLLGVGLGDGLDAPTPPQPATASTAVAAAMVIANFWRRSNAKVEKIRNVTRRVATTGNFMKWLFLSKRRSVGNGRILRFEWRLLQGRTIRGAVVWRDAAALARDAACLAGYVEIYSQCDLAERDCVKRRLKLRSTGLLTPSPRLRVSVSPR